MFPVPNPQQGGWATSGDNPHLAMLWSQIAAASAAASAGSSSSDDDPAGSSSSSPVTSHLLHEGPSSLAVESPEACGKKEETAAAPPMLRHVGVRPRAPDDDNDDAGDGAPGHDIVLQAAEGTRYRFSLTILAEYSHFAEGLLTLPTATTGSNQHTTDPETDTEPPVIEVPIRGQALSYMLECMMQLYHFRRLDPLVTTYAEEAYTFTDILDCPELFEELLLAGGEDDMPSRFILAVLTEDHARVSALSLRLLSFSSDYYTRGWWIVVLQNKAPHVVQQLTTLFDNWNSSYLYFQACMSPKFPRTVFSHKDYWLPSGSPSPCDQQYKHRGNFSAFHSTTIRPLWDSFSKIPLMSPELATGLSLRELVPQFNNVADNVATLGIKCSICSSFLLEEVKSVLSSWPDVDWEAKRTLGFAVAPSPADMDAWRVDSRPPPQ